MQLAVPSIVSGVALIAGGVIAVAPATPTLPDFHMPAVGLTAGGNALDTPDDLLNSAITNLTDANNLLSQVDVSNLTHVADPLPLQTFSLQDLNSLLSAEDLISAHDGSLQSLIDQLYFVPLDQQWVNATEAVLQADQAFAAAITSGSGLGAAEFGLVEPTLQLAAADFSSLLPVVFAADFFGATLP